MRSWNYHLISNEMRSQMKCEIVQYSDLMIWIDIHFYSSEFLSNLMKFVEFRWFLFRTRQNGSLNKLIKSESISTVPDRCMDNYFFQNELAALELIHALVETLDKYFENVVSGIRDVYVMHILLCWWYFDSFFLSVWAWCKFRFSARINTKSAIIRWQSDDRLEWFSDWGLFDMIMKL